MPNYEYKCEKCGKFVIFLNIDDDELEKCPTCNGPVKILIPTNINAEVKYDAHENYERVIKKEAHEIAEKIKNGDEKAAADIFGENKMFGE